MKRETLTNLQWVSRKFGFVPTKQQVQTLVDSHLEALDKIDQLTGQIGFLTGMHGARES